MTLSNRTAIRNRLLATVAFSALFGGIATAQTMPMPYNWTGFYVGGNLGYIGGISRGHDTSDFDTFGTASARGSSVIGGVQTGYNWQFGPIVLGMEGDFEFTGLNYSGNNGGTGDGFPAPLTMRIKLDELGTVRGRFGYAFSNMPLLVYGTGGIAYGNVTDAATGSLGGGAGGGSVSGWRTGWAAGGGFEYAFLPNWIARAEALYVDLGSVTNSESAFGQAYRFTVRDTAIIGRVGISFKF